MAILKLINSIYRRYKSAVEQVVLLKDFQSKNPTCRIMTTALHSVEMHENVAILNNSYLERVTLGRFSYVSNDSKLVNVKIGSFCSIGPHVQIGLGPHPSRDFISSYPAFFTDKNTGCPLSFRQSKIFDDSVPPTKLGHDVWVGSNVILPGGISVGTGAIIAAGAVVVKDVPPYAIVGGNPAKVIRYRFSEAEIAFILDAQWWNWPSEKIIKNVDGFADFDKFKVIAID
ncbi:MAG TPA: CatB-related O-acetyltransferase [Methylophilaceae bacterium]|nr:CatB-related O-acetyltransferase [Methylophilaceae bacterium]